MGLRLSLALRLSAALVAMVACVPPEFGGGDHVSGVTSSNHRWFPILEGTHAVGRTLDDGPIACESCHDATANSFTQFSCVGCHGHARALTDTLHGSTAGYAYSSDRCYACHPTGARVPFDHPGITGNCASCHDVGKPFAALPKPGFTHRNTGGADCGGCHVTTTWLGGSVAPTNAHDPTRNVLLVALIPAYSGTTIASLTPRAETLPMTMNHASPQLSAAALANCAACHAGSASGNFYPGVFHASLGTLGAAPPATCTECHALTTPTGFVGPTATSPVRFPPSGEMKHDAVAWTGSTPTTTRVVPSDCAGCHVAPSAAPATWTTGTNGAPPVLFHASLQAAQQPGSCVDCHANSRPPTVLTTANATLPANLAFDHTAPAALADCGRCHATGGATQWTSWTAGRFHAAGNPAPASCLPCHEGARAVMTSSWASPTWQASPFDYVTNPRGVTHGAGLDCVKCHAGPGTGAWGGTQNWQGGRFTHGPGTPSATGCIRCHMSQRPDLLEGTTPAAMAALLGFDHAVNGQGDCMGCHKATVTANAYVDYFDPTTHVLPGGDWKGATLYPSDAHDPLRNYTITALIPAYTGTSIASFTSQRQTLLMTMDHTTVAVPAASLAVCMDCHAAADVGAYYPGDFHSSLANLGRAQPSTCVDCHAGSKPRGFVGPLATQPARTPPSGEMKHDAVVWTAGARGTTAVVPFECGVCHKTPPTLAPMSWGTNAAGVAPAQFHGPITAAGLPQPLSCVDCHANSRPQGVLTPVTATLPTGMQFNHAASEALADCAACHATGGPTQWTSWAGGLHHTVGSATPSTCLPCHTNERPTDTTNWQSTTYQASPFDYGTNARGVTHGNGLDCVACHRGPGTGAWGGTQDWQDGQFDHAPTGVAGTTCIACHMTQRPDLQPGTTAAAMATLLGFDHALNGTGDCFGCHQATVNARTYANYVNPTTRALPNGDWMGGEAYPGSTLISSPTQFISVTAWTLQRSGPNNLVNGMTSVSATLRNAMLHASAMVPAPLNAGPTGSGDFTKCWHCHTNTAGMVTSYADGKYHLSLTNFTATVGGAVAPMAQPTTGCNDCHAQMRPVGIVEKTASDLVPMDHAAVFTAPVTIAGVSVIGVPGMDCSVCHASAGNTWADGKFHAKIGTAVPQDCVACHYPLMADAVVSDVTTAPDFAMHHDSPVLTSQNCAMCHATAVTNMATAAAVATSWRVGAIHPNLVLQPAACNECHLLSRPVAHTQSTWTYTLPAGGTTTNRGQWMNHTVTDVAGRDCVDCHRADARTSGSAWSRSGSLHTTLNNPSTCQGCHGLTNGGGSTVGTNNNLPTGLTHSPQTTTTTSAPGAGLKDQIIHTDINVSSHDCDFCHTQVGISTAPAIVGKEWAQAKFHSNFTGGTALVMNTTTGRCSNCHMNLKPNATYTAQDHSTFTGASGTQDCSSCHSLPGTGTASAPNWLGAAGMPAFISVGGFTIPQPPAAAAGTIQPGVNDLPHPTVATGVQCTACHATAAGGRRAKGYDHLSTLIMTNCNSCHEAAPAGGGAVFNDLLGTLWSGATTVHGTGDSRPYTLTAVVPSFKGNTRSCALPNHFYPTDCKECHTKPAGNGLTTSGASYITAWKFKHSEGAPMTKPATCNKCHKAPCNLPD